MNKDNLELVLGIDQGSSSTKAVLTDYSGNLHWKAKITVDTEFPEDSHATQDPEELYQSIVTVIDQAQDYAEQAGSTIKSMGFSFQRSGVCAWDKATHQLHSPLITWRDRRFAERVSKISEADQTTVKKLTSLAVIPDYAAAKISALQEKYPDKNILVGTLDSYIFHKLSSGKLFITEDSMASRTMLYNISEKSWDKTLTDIFDVESTRLAKIVPSLSELFKFQEIPILASLGDKQASLILEESQASINLGTMSNLSIQTGGQANLPEGFLASIFYSNSVSTEYLLEAVFNSSGAVLDHLKSLTNQNDLFQYLTDTYSNCAQADIPQAFLPLRGSGTPEWAYDLPNVISKDVSLELEVAACIEYIAFGISLLIERVQNLKLLDPKATISISGGLTQLELLLQLIADTSGVQLNCLETSEGSAYGAALAATRVLLDDPQLSWKLPISSNFKPIQNDALRRRYLDWNKLREQVLNNTTPKTVKIIDIKS